MFKKQEQWNKLISLIVFILAFTVVTLTILSHFQIINNSVEAIVMPIVGILLLREGVLIYKKYKIWGGVLILVSLISVVVVLIEFIKSIQS